MSKEIATLYKELISKVSSAPLSQLLPSALRLARELKNKDFEKWVRLELNGYFNDNPARTDKDDIPDYRSVAGQYSDVYGRPFVVRDARLSFVNSYSLSHGVAELEQMSRSSTMLSVEDPRFQTFIRDTFKVDVHSFNFSPSGILSILSSVRTMLLDWLYTIRPDVERVSGAVQEEGKTQVTPELQGLHPLVIQAVGNLYKDGHYREAILNAYIALVQAVKTKSARHDLDGSGLMQTVFSAKNPVLILSNDPDEQMGYMWMFSGAVMGIRNPKAHRLAPEQDPQIALELLSFASVLLRVLDRAKQA